ncbi:MAG: type IV-A pilus assembly ATPase PilB [Burkholderiaceae bacterium]
MIPATLASSGVARAVLQTGLVNADALQNLAQSLVSQPRRVIEALVAGKFASAHDIAHCLARTYNHPLLDLAVFEPPSIMDWGIDPKLLSSLQAVALSKRNNSLYIGLADPTDLQVLQQLKFHTHSQIEPVIVEYDKLTNWFNKMGQINSKQLDTELAAGELQLQEEEAEGTQIGTDVEDAPVVKYVQQMLMEAIRKGASDLHFEPYETFYRVRFRIDGVLQEIAQPPVSTREKICARIKILSRMDIAERRVPQDGRMRLVTSENKIIDFRVSTLPTLFGEKIVIRILDSGSAQLGIDALGYEPEQKALLTNAISRPDGMILVTGPTGSGKTVALYTCLNILNKPDVNISTAEDPSEINLPGINQVNIHDKAGLTFATALKAFLRQDPDIIMVGEIRDLETADIAIKAAQTGHLVFSTLHTNDAAATIVRLLNMGVPAFNIASSVLMITAQRLVRRLCSCKELNETPREALASIGFTDEELAANWMPYSPVGCERCNQTGYKGRTGIYEVLPITESIQSLIFANASALEIRKQARAEGVMGLREAGRKKVRDGITSIDEILSATQS